MVGAEPDAARACPTSPIEGLPFPPMEAELVRDAARRRRSGSSSRSGTASAGLLENLGRAAPLVAERADRCCATSRSCGRSASCCRRARALDGEIVIVRDGVLDFDAMQTRLHPAESRIRRLVGRDPGDRSSPSTCSSGRASTGRRARCPSARALLEAEARDFTLSPATADRATAARWLDALRGDRPRRRDRQAGRSPLPSRARATRS